MFAVQRGAHLAFSAPDGFRSVLRKLPLRLRLSLLVAGTLLPLLLFAVGLVYFNHMRLKEAAFARVLETVRGMRIVLDTELIGMTSPLEVMSAAQALNHAEMRR